MHPHLLFSVLATILALAGAWRAILGDAPTVWAIVGLVTALRYPIERPAASD